MFFPEKMSICLRQNLISKLLLSTSVRRGARKGMKWGSEGTSAGAMVIYFFFLASGISSLHHFPWTFLLVTFRSTSNSRSCPQLPLGLWASQAASTAAAPADGVYLNRQGESICVCVVLKFLGQHLQKAAYSVNYLHEVLKKTQTSGIHATL